MFSVRAVWMRLLICVIIVPMADSMAVRSWVCRAAVIWEEYCAITVCMACCIAAESCAVRASVSTRSCMESAISCWNASLWR